jgi:autotransporter-associated beta strand protein
VSTSGGRIVLAGGLDDGSNGGTAGDGIPDGYTYRQFYDYGIKSVDLGANVTLNSAGSDIILRGNGGEVGVGITGTGTSILSGVGNITIAGNSTNDWGVYLANSPTIQSTSGNISITSTSTKSSLYTYNASIIAGNSATPTSGGNITVNSTSTGGHGFYQDGGKLIAYGDISITSAGTSGRGYFSVNSSAVVMQSITGDIDISATSTSEWAFVLDSLGTIQANAGAISISAESNSGVYVYGNIVAGNDATNPTAGGAITISSGKATGTGNGIQLNSAKLISYGDMTLSGTSSSAYGIYTHGNTIIDSGAGAIDIDAVSGTNSAFYVVDNLVINSDSTAAVAIDISAISTSNYGFINTSSASNKNLLIQSTSTTANTGDIRLTGQTSGAAFGVALDFYGAGAETEILSAAGDITISSLGGNDGHRGFYSNSDIFLGQAFNTSVLGVNTVSQKSTGNISILSENNLHSVSKIVVRTGDATNAGGNVVFASDIDGTGEGSILFRSGLEVYSYGGDITFGGGDNNASSYAIGSDESFSWYGAGLRFDSGLILDSSGNNTDTGGNITLRGQGYSGTAAGDQWAQGIIINQGNTIVNSGSGKLNLVAKAAAQSNATAVAFHINGGGNHLFTSAATSADAITLTADASGSSSAYAEGIMLNAASGQHEFVATGSGGGVSITAKSGISDAEIMQINDPLYVLANGGDILIDAISPRTTTNSRVYANGGNLTLGYTDAANTTFDVTQSNSNITLRSTGGFDYSGLITAKTGDADTIGGNFLIASDTNGSGTGSIALYDGLNVSTFGGDITLGGGDETGSGYAVGFTDYISRNEGVRIDRTVMLNSAGGDIAIRGKTPTANLYWSAYSGYGNAGFGIYHLNSAALIDAGEGTVSISGINQNPSYTDYSSGLVFALNSGYTTTITSANTTDSAISITGLSTGTNGGNYGMEVDINSPLIVAATGVGGGVDLNVSAESSDYDLVTRSAFKLFANGGDLTLSGGATGAGWYKSASAYLASMSGSTVSSSASDTTLSFNDIHFTDATPIDIATTGTVAWEPSGDSFTRTQYSSWIDWNQNSQTMTGLRIGKVSNTQGVYVDSALNVAGAASFYGNNITITSPISTTVADAGIDLIASENIFLGSQLTTQGGNILLSSNSDSTAGGHIVVNKATLSSNGGDITLGGGADGSGYAEGTASASGLATWAGTDLYKGIFFNASTLNAGGGDIEMRGKGWQGGNIGNYFTIGIDIVGYHADGAAPTITTSSEGTINIAGIGGNNYNAGTTGVGINFFTDVNGGVSKVYSENGSITLTGTAGTGTARLLAGIRNDAGANQASVYSTTGDIILEGMGTSNDAAFSTAAAFNIGWDGTNAGTTGNIILRGDNLQPPVINSLNLKASGKLIIEPYSDDFSASFTTAGLNVGSTFSGLTIGKQATASDGVNDANVTIASDFSIAGDINIYSGRVDLSANLNATNGDIYIGAPIKLFGDSSIATNAADGDITLASTIDGLFDLTVNSGAGDISFGGEIGSSNALYDFSVTSSAGISLANDVTTLGTQSYNGDVTLTQDVSLTSYGVQASSGTYSYTGSTETLSLEHGGLISLTLIGGQGGGYNRSSASRAPGGTYQATVALGAATDLTIAVGGDASARTGGNNPLSGFDGGTGGSGNTHGWGGGAATVVEVGDSSGVFLVAGGGQGGGGEGQYWNRSYGVYSTSSTTSGASGQNGSGPGGGGGGGGVIGGSGGLAGGTQASTGTAGTSGKIDANGVLTLTNESTTNSAAGTSPSIAYSVAAISSGISFTGKVDGAQSLTTEVGNGGSVSFSDDLGATTALSSLSVTGGATLAGNVTTSSALVFNNKLSLNGSNAVLSGTGVDLAQVVLGSYDLEINDDGTGSVSGVISGSGNLTKSGTGELTLSKANTLTGGVTLSGGSIVSGISNVFNASTALSIAAGTTWDLNDQDVIAGSLTGAGTVNLGSGSLTVGANNSSFEFAGTITESGTLIKSGSGTLTLSGTNTFTGDLNITAGTVVAASNSALGSSDGKTVVSSGATLDLDGVNIAAENLVLSGGTLKDVTSSWGGDISLTADSTFEVGAGDQLTISGVISGDGYAITKTGAGELLLTANNTYSGTTTISAGTLTLANDNLSAATSGFAGTGVLNIRSASDDFASDFSTGSWSFASSLGDVTIGKATAADGNADVAITLASDINTSGALTVYGGAIQIDGNLNSTAAMLVKASSDLTLSNGVSLTAAADQNVVLITENNFINNAGANVISVSGSGRWIVYAADKSDNSYGALNSENQAIWGQTYSSLAPASVDAGNRYVFAETASNDTTVEITTTDKTKTYGETIDLSDAYSYTVTVGVASEANVYIGSGTVSDDFSLTDAFSVLPQFSSTKAAASAGVGSASITHTAGTLNSGYVAVYNDDGVLTVTKKALTITADDQSKVYGATDPSLTATYSGFVNDEDASVFSTALSLSTATGSSATAGTHTITAADAAAANYDISFVNGTLTVSKAALTITAEDKTKVYGASEPTLTADYAGFQYDDDASVFTSALSLSTATGSSATAGTHTITAADAAAANYDISFVNGTLTVDKAALTITADDFSKTYGDADPTLTAQYAGFVYDEDESVLSTALSLSTATGSSATAGTHTITAADAAAANYDITLVDGTLTVNKAALTITADDQSKTYGDTDPTLTAQYDGFVYDEDESVFTTALSLSTATGSSATAGTHTITAADAEADNYTITFVDGTLNVAQKVVALDVADKVYDGTTDMTGYVTITTGVGDETLTYSGALASDAHVATADKYLSTISLENATDGSGGLASNYALPTLDNSTAPVTITAATLTPTITNANYSQVYDGDTAADMTPSWSFAGLVSGDTDVTLSMTDLRYDSANVLDATQITASGLSISGITGSNSSAVTDYVLDATAKSVAATITAKTVSLSASRVYDGTTDLMGAVSLDTGINGETLAYNSAIASDAHVATASKYIQTIALTDTETALASNYALPTLDADNAPVTITPASLTVSVTNTGVSKVYDGTDYAPADLQPEFVLSGLVAGDSSAQISYTGANYDDKDAAADKTITFSGLAIDSVAGTNSSAASDYVLSSDYSTIDAAITKASLTISANDDAKFVTQADQTGYNGVVYSGFVGGEDSTELDGTLTISRSDYGNDLAGSYDLVAAGVTAANYDISFVNGTYTIVPADELLVEVDDISIGYGSDFTYTVTSAKYLDSDINEIVDLLANTSVSGNSVSVNDGIETTEFDISVLSEQNSTSGYVAAGAYQLGSLGISAGGTNFDGLNVIGSLSVAAKGIAISTSNIAKTYDGTTSVNNLNLTMAGQVAGDVLNVSGIGAFGDKNVGTGLSYSVSNITLSGDDAANYYLTNGASMTGNNGVITARALSVSGITAANKVYDGTDAVEVDASNAIYAGLVAGDDFAIDTVTGLFDDKNVGTAKTVNLTSVYAGADLGNYTITDQLQASADITPKAITVSGITVDDKVYDGGVLATVDTSAASGWLDGDSVLLNTSGLFADKNVGINKAVTLTTEYSGADAANYSFTDQTTAYADISQKTLTLSGITAADKTYDATMSATIDVTAAVYSGLVDGDEVAVSATGSFSDKNVATDKLVTLLSSYSGVDVSNYAITDQSSTTADINAKTVTISGITAEDKVYDQGLTATVDTSNASGWIIGDDITLTATGLFTNKNVGTDKTVRLTSSYAGDDVYNYLFNNQTTTTADITQKALTLKNITVADKVYDATNNATVDVSTAVYDGLIAGDDVVVAATGLFSDKNVGTDKTVNLTSNYSGADLNNYAISDQLTALADISAKAITISGITASNKEYDQTTLATVDTSNASGWISGDDVAVTATGLFSDKNVGVAKTVTLSSSYQGVDVTNYTFTHQANTTADITAKALSLSGITVADKVYDANTTSTVDVSGAVYSGLIAGDDVQVAAVGTFSNKNVGTDKTVALGSTYSGVDVSNYLITDQDDATASIIAKAITISGISAADKVYDQTVAATVDASSAMGWIAGDDVAVSATGVFEDKNAANNKTVILSSSYTGADVTNYLITDQADTQAAITRKAVSISGIVAADKVYDANEIASIDSASAQGWISGDDVSVSATGLFADKNVADGKTVSLTSSYSGADTGNYIFADQTTTTAAITPKSVLVTAKSDAKFVGQADDTSSYNGVGFAGVIYNGFVGGETEASLLGANEITLGSISRVDGSNNVNTDSNNQVTSYVDELSPSGWSASNYTFSYEKGDYMIAPADHLLVELADQSAVYGADVEYSVTSAKYFHDTNNNAIADAGEVITVSNLPASCVSCTVDDGLGSRTSFDVEIQAPTFNSSGDLLAAGGYILSPENVTISGANFNAVTVYGALSVTPKQIDSSSFANLGVSEITKVYDGNVSIRDLSLDYSRAMAGIEGTDVLGMIAAGSFDNRHVGDNKRAQISMALNGADASNYALSDSNLAENIGVITQLDQVAWVGSNDTNWSDANNWAGGAIPDNNNVATIVIPENSVSVYDVSGFGSTSAAIVNNGVIRFAENSEYSFANNVSGSGSLQHRGEGVLVVSGDNSFTGDIDIATQAVRLASTNALGAGEIVSTGGILELTEDLLLPSLTVNGDITVVGDIATQGAQTYNGGVTIGSGSVAAPLNMTSNGGALTFNGTVEAGLGSKASTRSLTIDAGAGSVVFNEQVGQALTDGDGRRINFSAFNSADVSLYALDVTAADITLNADITTFETQTYNGQVWIGDNGTNGLTRLLVSLDPAITFNGAVDDVVPGTHTLDARAIALNTQTVAPNINFAAVVGSYQSLYGLNVVTGVQDQNAQVANINFDNPAEYLGDITFTDSVTTSGNQSYTTNSVELNAASGQMNFNSANGGIEFNLYRAGTSIADISGTATRIGLNVSNRSQLQGNGQSFFASRGLGVSITESRPNIEFARRDDLTAALIGQQQRHRFTQKHEKIDELDIRNSLMTSSTAGEQSQCIGEAGAANDSGSECTGSVEILLSN